MTDEYCTFCGIDQDGTVHECYNIMNCETCCNALYDEWTEHWNQFNPDHLAYPEWLKLAQPTRVLKVDLDDAELVMIENASAALGLTVDEFMVQAVETRLNRMLGREEVPPC